MSCHETGGEVDPDALPDETVALVGAPNVGKSVLFGELADTYVDVSNYPGTTVDTTVGRVDGRTLTDTPGAYGISSFNEEERIARDIVLDADAVINVVDATHLDRDLFLTLQLLDMGKPTVVALNMIDEAERDGIEIDVDELERRLGVPVVPTVAIDGTGVDDLRDRIDDATVPDETGIEDWFDELPADIEASRAEKTLLVEGDEPTVERVADRGTVVADGGTATIAPAGLRDEVYSHRRDRIGSLTDEVVIPADGPGSVADRLSDLLVSPLTGTPIMLGLLAAIYYLIGDLVAQRVVDFMEVEVFGQYYNPAVTDAVGSVVPAQGWTEPLHFLLLNENLGLLTVTVQYIVGVLLPLVVAFYFAIGVLEDSGVLPRLAVLTDRGMSRLGLNGRAIIPMIVGVGCVTMAVITTRMMGSRRERLIATALLGLAIPCSAQLGVIMGMLAGLGLIWWFGYVGVLVLVFGIAGVALDRVLPGESEALVTELPRMRVPRVGNILRKTWNRTKMFLREAIPLFGVTAVVISALDYLGGLDAIERTLAPVTSFVGLPTDFAQVLVLGVIRRDFAAAGMSDMTLSNPQIFVGLVLITLFVPCILSMVMIVKERDATSGAVMWIGSWIVAFLVGGLLAGVLL
jgi:ferrous iron transport protein B